MKANPLVIKTVRVLTIGSVALTSLAGGLALLPIDSAHLPMPPEWRPYLAGTAVIALSIRTVVIPTLDAIISHLNKP